MARSFGFSSQSKAVIASGTTIFSGNDFPLPVPGQSIVGIMFEQFDGTAGTNDSNEITRIRLKAGGVTIVDCEYTQLQNFVAAIGTAHEDMGAANQQTYIPLNLFDEENADDADRCAFPLGAQPQLEVSFSATPAASPLCRVGWVLSDVDPVFFPNIRTNPHNIVGATTNGQVQLTERGLLRAFMFPDRATNGSTRHKLVLQGITRIEGTPDMLLALQGIQSHNVAAIATVDHIWLKIEGMQQPAAAGVSYYEQDTGSASVAADEYGMWALRTQGA